ncbi:MAG TPA: MFS transporter [Gaiellaceae bacterium]|nr:MFS transporter [Gaiellaceae bacterium]
MDLDAAAALSRALRVYYGIEFFEDIGRHAAFTVWAVYLVRDVGLNPLELVLLGTVGEISYFLLEVPTGVIADAYSRRLSVILGLLVNGVSVIVVGITHEYAILLAGSMLWGLGSALMSGAYEAWITDEHGVDGIARVYMRGAQFGYSGAILGAILGVAVATQDLGAALVFGGAVTFATGVVCMFVMPEEGFRRRPPAERLTPARELKRNAVTGARLIRGHHVLLLIVGITFFAGAASEGLDRLWEAHLIRDVGLPELWGLDPVVWFGVFNVVGLAVGIVVTSLLVPRFAHAGDGELAAALLALTAILSISMVVFGLAAGFALAAGAYLVARLARRITDPLYLAWLNRNIEDSSVRATVNSLVGQSDAIGEIAGGPAIGIVGTLSGMRAALVASGLLLTPALALYGRALRHGGREPELEEAEAPA